MGETVALPNGRIEVERRPGYLFLVEHGTLLSTEEVDQYGVAMELLSARTGVRRALIDSRGIDEREPEPEVREAMWRWLLSARAFDQVAFVLGNEMAVVRVNMLARSQRAGICAFGAVHEAHRWLTGRQRTLSHNFSAPLGTGALPGVATPVPPPRAESPARAESITPPGLRRSQLPPAPPRAVVDSSLPGPPRAPSSTSIASPSPSSTGRYSAQPASEEQPRRTTARERKNTDEL